MQILYYDIESKIETATARNLKKLAAYRADVTEVIDAVDSSRPEFALAAWQDNDVYDTAQQLAKKFTKAKHVIVIGIGGSSLGVEAIDAVLAPAKRERFLHVIDTVSAYCIETLLAALATTRRARDVVVCVISKSGGTTETLANSAVLMDVLVKKFGATFKKQCIYIGDSGSPLLETGAQQGGEVVQMPKSVGGRYSVFTAVGIVPLALLGYDIAELREGCEDAANEDHEELSAESAARLFSYASAGVRTLNFFGFDPRLQSLGFWYRQLVAESLGKDETRAGKPLKYGMLPTITTPVELHSVGQLYFSKFPGVYTDLVSFDDTEYDATVSPKTTMAPALAGQSLGNISAAIFAGVVAAYQASELPYRSTTFDDSLAYSLGLFMSMRMRETMYVAELMDINAFDQPHVELYKKHTKKFLKA